MTLSRSFGVRLGILLSLLVLCVNVLSASSRLGFLHKPKQVKELDHLRYIEMARGPQGRPQLAREATQRGYERLERRARRCPRRGRLTA